MTEPACFPLTVDYAHAGEREQYWQKSATSVSHLLVFARGNGWKSSSCYPFLLLCEVTALLMLFKVLASR